MVNYPSDWSTYTIKDLISITRGASPRPIENFLTSSNSGVPWIKIGDAQVGDKYISSTSEKITSIGACYSVIVNVGDFILSNSMSFGRPYILTIKGCIHDGWLRLFEYENSFNREYLYFLLSSSIVQKQYEKLIAGSGVKNLNKQLVKKVEITIPLLKEQERISETLTAMDDYIENLSELIAKKKMIRDGAIEDLLSGQKRLNGFETDWVKIPFNKFFTFLPTNTCSRDQLSEKGFVGNIHYGDVLIKYKSIISDDAEIPKLKKIENVNNGDYLKKNDVIIADTAEDETVGKVVQIGDLINPVVSGLHTIACRPQNPTADGFLGYYMNCRNYHKQILYYVVGTKVSSISKKSICKTFLYVPQDLNEQKEIVSVLAALDSEITILLEKKLKIEQIREGALDDLLTGRVRLK